MPMKSTKILKFDDNEIGNKEVQIDDDGLFISGRSRTKVVKREPVSGEKGVNYTRLYKSTCHKQIKSIVYITRESPSTPSPQPS